MKKRNVLSFYVQFLDPLVFARARIGVETANKHPSMLELLNFPSDQKYGIYLPLFLPLFLPILQPLLHMIVFILKIRDN